LREFGTASDSNVNSTGQAYTNTITSSSKKDKNGNQYMDASDWGGAVVDAAVVAISQMKSSPSSLNVSQALALGSFFYYQNTGAGVSKPTNVIARSSNVSLGSIPKAEFYETRPDYYFVAIDSAAILFAQMYTVVSADMKRELFAYVYKVDYPGINITLYSLSDVYMLGGTIGYRPIHWSK